MPRRYKPVDDCRYEIQDYIDELDAGTDDDDDDLRQTGSTRRYKQDLRWYDHWLDDHGIDSVLDVTPADASRVGRALSNEFNGTTPRYRWDRINAFHDYLVNMELAESNPLARWNGSKDSKWGMTKTTQQERELEDGERYATSQEDIRKMEKNVGRNRVRDQLVIRMMWQTALRRGEQSLLTTDMLDREAREIELPGSITKNGKRRVVAYQPSLDGLLKEWLDYSHRDEMLGGNDHDYLFVGERGARLHAERINEIIIDAADRAGINRYLYADANAAMDEDGNPIPNRWLISAHNVRHGYGTYMIHEAPEEGEEARLWEVSKQMGHSSVKITEERYVEDDPRAGVGYAHSHGPD
ncbi:MULTISPECIES: tyrosine-type recombinase/integrase [Halorussus]|uniref:tyrosine-type recombinase/integrase n=1 Tax=Halorussus TaxID=1070314 RepID=UPI0020A05E58|nr:site-specific integrase [Halorussus vallis]USZ74065.1 site-specific integrase [Halorussus vallis]